MAGGSWDRTIADMELGKLENAWAGSFESDDEVGAVSILADFKEALR
jgi:hypothetical protein